MSDYISGTRDIRQRNLLLVDNPNCVFKVYFAADLNLVLTRLRYFLREVSSILHARTQAL